MGVGAGSGATQATATLSVSLAAGSSATPGTRGVDDASDAADATAFDAAVDQKSAAAIGASPTPAFAEAPADAYSHAELGAGSTFTTQAHEDTTGVGTSAGAEAASAVAANATDASSLAASLDATAGARATEATDGLLHAAAIAATLGVKTSRPASDAALDGNTNAAATAAVDASALAAPQAEATAGGQTDATAGADRARQQATQELWRAMARGQTGNAAAAVGAQGSIDSNAAAQSTRTTDLTAATSVTVTDPTTAIDAGAVAHVDVAVAAQAHEAEPRAKSSKAEAAIDANAWAGAAVADAASAEHASGQSTNGNGSNGRGREAPSESFGGLVSSLRHASDSGVPGLSAAFDARSLMASAINAGLDAQDASGASASTIVTTAPPDEQAAQIVRGMRLHWRGTVGEAQLRLAPEHLGQIFVNVKVDQGSVTATMHAETPAAQQWIQAHQQQLRDALDAQGLRVAHIEVTTDPEDRPRRDHDQGEPQEKPRGRAQTRARDGGEAPRFEIRM